MRITTPSSLGKYIAQKRQLAGYSQAQLGNLVGKDQRFISRVETKTASITFVNLMKVMTALDIRLDISSDSESNYETKRKLPVLMSSKATDASSISSKLILGDVFKSIRKPTVVRKLSSKKYKD